MNIPDSKPVTAAEVIAFARGEITEEAECDRVMAAIGASQALGRLFDIFSADGDMEHESDDDRTTTGAPDLAAVRRRAKLSARSRIWPARVNPFHDLKHADHSQPRTLITCESNQAPILRVRRAGVKAQYELLVDNLPAGYTLLNITLVRLGLRPRTAQAVPTVRRATNAWSEGRRTVSRATQLAFDTASHPAAARLIETSGEVGVTFDADTGAIFLSLANSPEGVHPVAVDAYGRGGRVVARRVVLLSGAAPLDVVPVLADAANDLAFIRVQPASIDDLPLLTSDQVSALVQGKPWTLAALEPVGTGQWTFAGGGEFEDLAQDDGVTFCLTVAKTEEGVA